MGPTPSVTTSRDVIEENLHFMPQNEHLSDPPLDINESIFGDLADIVYRSVLIMRCAAHQPDVIERKSVALGLADEAQVPLGLRGVQPVTR